MGPEEAVRHLKQAGLSAVYLGGPDDRILVGSRVREVGGIAIYQDGSAIYRDRDRWLFARPGPGQLQTEVGAATLEEVVAAACHDLLATGPGSVNRPA